MAPKNKKGKKAAKAADDDWENDIPQEAEDLFTTPTKGDTGAADADAAAANGSAEPEAASAADIADDFDGGGLLGAIKKNRDKKKKGKGNKNASDDQIASALAALTTNDDGAPAVAAPTEATEDDFGPVGKQKKGKGGKGGGNQAAAAAPAPVDDADKDDDEDADGDTGGKVLTKKEKEKLKKEREKQRKKEQAARKKAQGPAADAGKAAPEAEAAPAADAAATLAATPAAKAPEPAAATGGKKKKLNPALAALQRQQELLRQQEEERRRLEEEEKRLAEEEEKRLAEEEKRKEEAKARKKEKEKEKKEQLRKEGKLLTKAQREAYNKQQLRLQQMIEAGIVVPGMVDPEAAKKKPVYDKKKKKPAEKSKAEKEEQERKEEEARKQKEAEERAAAQAKEEEEKRKAEEEKKAAEEAEEEAAKKAKEEDVLDDWDAAVDSDGNIKEDWDQDSGEEEEKKPEPKDKAATNGKKGKAPASESESESESEDEAISAAKKAAQQKKDEAAERRKKQHEEALAARSKDNLRSPICCILGHVDTGKTKLLDKIRQTNVQEGEAGGITQQIGATYFPQDAIKQKTDIVNEKGDFEIKVPGLLIIDTPGHESFTNLRSRGSSLCNIAILVVDIMHGLEQQTLESIRLLRDRKTPFLVALNKIDRLYGWKATPNNGFRDSLARQSKSVQTEFKNRLERTKLAFSEQGLNAELFYENKNMAKFVSLIPTSAHTGEGIPDMLRLIVSLTQQRLTEKLMYLSELEATVLEVKVIEGLGTTIDVVLSNGVLREGDRIVLCGLNGPICTNVRALLTPQPLKELRVKGSYVHHKMIKAAMGVKIAANDLEDAIAGSRLLVVGPDDDEEDLEDEVMSDLEGLLNKVTKGGKGVCVQASTLGSLEALLEFLKVSNIPVMSISIGPVYKRDVMRAGTMVEKNKEFAVMLCFDVKVDKEAQAYAEEVGVKIFTADIIYHLFDAFTAYQKDLLEQKREESKADAVFPCVLNTVAVFHQRDPIVVGVDVTEGSLRIGTPIAAVKVNATTGEREPVVLGRVTSIELNHKAVPICKKGSPSVAVKIEAGNQPILGRHWEEKDVLYSHISRKSIDTLKNHFREEVAKEDWQLMIQLKKVFKID